MTRRHAFFAGKYWITDPCYAVADKKWDKLLDDTGFFGLPNHKSINYDDGIFEYNGEKCFAHGTAFGDGVFEGSDNFGYAVDAGLLAIIPEKSADDTPTPACARMVTFDEDFLVFEDNGVFHFGNIIIDTN